MSSLQLDLQLQTLPTTRLEHGAHLPETRLPALHPFTAAAISATGGKRAASIETAVEGGETDVVALLTGFARLVAALGGLDELAFGFRTGPKQQESVIHAAVNEDASVSLQIVEGESEDGSLDFVLALELEEKVKSSIEPSRSAR